MIATNLKRKWDEDDDDDENKQFEMSCFVYLFIFIWLPWWWDGGWTLGGLTIIQPYFLKYSGPEKLVHDSI